jgi:hypothetical protein
MRGYANIEITAFSIINMRQFVIREDRENFIASSKSIINILMLTWWLMDARRKP